MDPIFKGATRPAMALGIPLLPLVLCAMSGLLLAIWSLLIVGPFLGLLVASKTIMLLVYMRLISKQDDQKLHQIILRLQSHSARRNFNYWACKSSSPLPYMVRHHPSNSI